MNREEAVVLCRMAKAACPQQSFDAYTPDAWAEILKDYRLEDAREALFVVARKQPWVAPAEIIAEVKKIRRKRIDEYGPITPPADLDPDDVPAYRQWWRDVQRAIADGDLQPKELELPKRDMSQMPRVFKRPAELTERERRDVS